MEALKAKLAVQEIELQQKNDAADALIEIVGVETEKVQSEKALGNLNYWILHLIKFILQTNFKIFQPTKRNAKWA